MVLKKVYFAIILSLLLLVAYSGFTQTDTQTSDNNAATQTGKTDSGFNLSLGLGVDIFEENGSNVSYQKVALSPDVAFGPFGIGLDVAFHYRFDHGSFVPKVEGDWIPYESEQGNPTSWLELYISKLKYVRYGKKGENLYIKFGSIDDGTLGNGFIMGMYSNTLFLPGKRILGLSLDFDTGLFGVPIAGLETNIGNIGAFDVIGTRLYVRPLSFLNIPVINGLQVGGEFALDRLPYKYSADPAPADAMALLFGGDVRLPILSNDVLGLAVFGDVSSYKGRSIGAMTGFSGSLFNILIYGAQARFIGDGFIPVYFDANYDVSRKEKYDLIESGTSPGYIGWLATLGTSLFKNAFSFIVSLDGPFSEVDHNNPNNYLNFPHLRGVAKVEEGLLPGVSLDMLYDKTYLRDIGSLITPEGALAMIRINYKIESVLITFFYNLKFKTDDWTTPEMTSGLETSIQLF